MFPLIVFTVIFVVLAVAGPLVGADSRDGGDWKAAERALSEPPPGSGPHP